MTAAEGTAYLLAMPDAAWEMLHQVDRRASGEIGMPAVVTTVGQRFHFRPAADLVDRLDAGP